MENIYIIYYKHVNVTDRARSQGKDGKVNGTVY